MVRSGKFVRRRGYVYVICKESPKHKQRQGYHTLSRLLNTSSNVLLNTNYTAINSIHHNNKYSNSTHSSNTTTNHINNTTIHNNYTTSPNQQQTITRYIHTHPQPQPQLSTHNLPTHTIYSNLYALQSSCKTAVQLSYQLLQHTRTHTNNAVNTIQQLIRRYM